LSLNEVEEMGEKNQCLEKEKNEILEKVRDAEEQEEKQKKEVMKILRQQHTDYLRYKKKFGHINHTITFSKFIFFFFIIFIVNNYIGNHLLVLCLQHYNLHVLHLFLIL
jgi:negative regulator of genetic competence, sporulation and motility